MAYRAIVDSHVLVSRVDGRDPRRRARAIEVVLSGTVDESLAVPHQSIVEFVSAVSRTRPGEAPLVAPGQLAYEVEELLSALPVLYPTEAVVREALRSKAAYDLSWFDAHLLAYAQAYDVRELISEDFQHGRSYGLVRVRNPFLDLKESPRGGKAKA